MNTDQTFSTFRKIAMVEGISFLVLLFIAMPLKYISGIPMAVTIVGSIHGALFIAFMIWMYLVYDRHNKTIGWMARAFLASIIPFGTFVEDRRWKIEAEQTVIK